MCVRTSCRISSSSMIDCRVRVHEWPEGNVGSQLHQWVVVTSECMSDLRTIPSKRVWCLPSKKSRMQVLSVTSKFSRIVTHTANWSTKVHVCLCVEWMLNEWGVREFSTPLQSTPSTRYRYTPVNVLLVYWTKTPVFCFVFCRFCHDDVIKWKHFLRYWALVRGIHRSPGTFPCPCTFYGYVSRCNASCDMHSLFLIPPLHRGCDLCASLVRPPNWPGRRWRQKGGRTVALVVQGWHIGRSDIAMDAMVAMKFWACSKQSHKGCRGGRSLTGRSKEARWRHTHRRGRRMDAQWSAIGRPVKNANIVYQCERHVCLPCTTIVPPLADQWRPLSDHCGDHCASIQRLRQHLSHHGNGSAFTLPSLRDQLCHYSTTAFKEGTRVFLGSGDHWAS